MRRVELTDAEFGELYDSLGDQADSHVIMWEELDADLRRQIRALHGRGFDAGHAQGEQDGYQAAEAALRDDLGALPWRDESEET